MGIVYRLARVIAIMLDEITPQIRDENPCFPLLVVVVTYSQARPGYGNQA
jgi:hypothetical protein